MSRVVGVVLIGVAALTSAGATSSNAQVPVSAGSGVVPGPADALIAHVVEGDRGGAPNDGDLWRSSTTVAVDGRPGVVIRRQVVSNTPIPDTVESRRDFGEPLSAAGRRSNTISRLAR